MPTQLHSLSENMRASAWQLALALQLQTVPGSLPSHYAVSLVGGTHFRCCIRKHTFTCERKIVVVFLLFFQKSPKASLLTLLCMQIFIVWRLTVDTTRKLRLLAWNADHDACIFIWPILHMTKMFIQMKYFNPIIITCFLFVCMQFFLTYIKTGIHKCHIPICSKRLTY